MSAFQNVGQEVPRDGGTLTQHAEMQGALMQYLFTHEDWDSNFKRLCTNPIDPQVFKTALFSVLVVWDFWKAALNTSGDSLHWCENKYAVSYTANLLLGTADADQFHDGNVAYLSQGSVCFVNVVKAMIMKWGDFVRPLITMCTKAGRLKTEDASKVGTYECVHVAWLFYGFNKDNVNNGDYMNPTEHHATKWVEVISLYANLTNGNDFVTYESMKNTTRDALLRAYGPCQDIRIDSEQAFEWWMKTASVDPVACVVAPGKDTDELHKFWSGLTHDVAMVLLDAIVGTTMYTREKFWPLLMQSSGGNNTA